MTTLIIIGILLIVLSAGLMIAAYTWARRMVAEHCYYKEEDDL